MRQVSQDQKDAHRYDDLLDLPHPVSKNHRPMPRLDRAAQFAPFAALTGYDESIQDAARKPEAREERSESEMEELNAKIQLLSAQIKSHPEIVIRYYQTETEKEHTKVLRKDGVIMPEAGQQPDNQNVDDLTFQTKTVAAQRNIYIITEPIR